jgi:PAT family beta-lactamase induction signal transducer AmpG
MIEAATKTNRKPRLLNAFAVFGRRRTFAMLGLGFASGLPYLLIFDTLSAWLREAGLPLSTISAFVLATFCYTFKFVWAPVIDRVALPGLTRLLGQRRAWMLAAQIAIMLGLFALSACDPVKNLPVLAVFCVLVGFFSATHDIVIDAWRIEAAPRDEQGAMAAAVQWGFRIAMITAGVAPLVLADRYGWHLAYAAMASLMVVGLASTLLAPIPPAEATPAADPGERAQRSPLVHIRDAVVDPFVDFFRRFGPWGLLILALICFYRLSDFSLTIMNPFYLDLGFSKTDIAEVRKVFGVIMTSLGIGVGGLAIARFGLIRVLVVGAFLAPLTHLSFAWLATQGPHTPALMICIALDNLSEGVAGTCLIAYMSSLTTLGSTATQYALFSSLYALPGKTLGANSGRVIESLARAAAPGGPLAGWTRAFQHLPAQSFKAGAAKLGVPPSALAAGYGGFFFYACLLGGLGVILSILVAWLKPGERAGAEVQIPSTPAPAA